MTKNKFEIDLEVTDGKQLKKASFFTDDYYSWADSCNYLKSAVESFNDVCKINDVLCKIVESVSPDSEQVGLCLYEPCFIKVECREDSENIMEDIIERWKTICKDISSWDMIRHYK